MNKFYTVLPFATALYIRDGKVLIGRQPDIPGKPYPHYWDLPGGKLERDETMKECIVREFYEETGFKVKDMEVFGHFHNAGEDVKARGILPGFSVCYKILDVSGDFKPVELLDMDFMEIKDVLKLELTPWTRFYLELL